MAVYKMKIRVIAIRLEISHLIKIDQPKFAP